MKHSANVACLVNGCAQLVACVAALRKFADSCEVSRTTLILSHLHCPDQSGEAAALKATVESIAAPFSFSETCDLENFPIDSQPTHIFINLEWLTENRNFIGLFPKAKVICYGDGIGLYYPDNREFSRKRHPANYKQINAATSYYLYKADCYGPNSSPSKFTKISTQEIRSVFNEIRSVSIVAEASMRLQNAISDQPFDLLLTSNFSEANRMSRNSEIRAYFRYIYSRKKRSRILVIKSHPRDSQSKASEIELTMRALYERVHRISNLQDSRLPVECLISPSVSIKNVFCFSTAAYTFPVFFGICPTVGFGLRNSRFFYLRSIFPRLRHERSIRRVLGELQASRKPPHEADLTARDLFV